MNVIRYFSNESELLTFAELCARTLQDGAVIFLNGPLGVGKTTFVRGFLSGLGFTEKVKSPTYTIVEPYKLSARDIFHFDFYRIHEPSELSQLGLEEYFTATSICLIEWPEKGASHLPPPDLVINLEFSGTARKATLEALTERGVNVLEQV